MRRPADETVRAKKGLITNVKIQTQNNTRYGNNIK